MNYSILCCEYKKYVKAVYQKSLKLFTKYTLSNQLNNNEKFYPTNPIINTDTLRLIKICLDKNFPNENVLTKKTREYFKKIIKSTTCNFNNKVELQLFIWL